MIPVAMAVMLAWPVAVLVMVGFVTLLMLATRPAKHRRPTSSSRRQRRHIYRERDRAIADIVAMRQEAERRMRKIAREEDVIEGSAVDE